METTVQKAQDMEGGVGPSKPPLNEEKHDSYDDNTAIEISSDPMFGFDAIDLEEVQ